jgi:hypothetical protein
MMRWCMSNRADPVARVLADRHYNRQAIGAEQFVPPGRCVVFVEDTARAFWITSWPFPEYVKHAWPGAWVCSAFRSEDAGGSIELVRQGIAATRASLGEPPDIGMVTFIDPSKVKPTLIRNHPTWGWIWIKAGFRYVGQTKSGKFAFQILPAALPPAIPAKQRLPNGLPLFDDVPA